jgi:4-amino-4-deoxy-L-arabinose transferase-like glycosyltransferase
MPRIKPSVRLAVVPFLAVHAALLAVPALHDSPTFDETAHLPAGVSHWQYGTFDLFRVNPPLVRMVAALPALAVGTTTDWRSFDDAPGTRPEFQIGRDFLYANGERSFWLFFLSRCACIPFSLLGAYLCYRWAKDLYGPRAGLLALALWCFSPNILAHGHVMTPDVGGTAAGVAAAYLFWRWLKSPDWFRAVCAGVVLGVAELTKATWIILFPMWPLVWVTWRLTDASAAGREWREQATQLVVVLLLAVYVINAGYAFEGTFTRLGDYQFVSRRLRGDAALVGNRFAASWIGNLPVPLPKNYVSGIDVQKHSLDRPKDSFLRGEIRYHGWWYYYLYGLAVKVPLGTWALILLAIALSIRHASQFCVRWRDELMLLAPLVVVLVFVSSQSGFSRHLRYVLPIAPYAFIWMSKVARTLELRHWCAVCIGGAALVWSVASSLSVYPHSISYFNELAGGPRGGHNHLLHSNIDWGQDLLYLKAWYDEHPEARPFNLAYYGYTDPRIAGIEFTLPPQQPVGDGQPAVAAGTTYVPQPGWYAISVQALRGMPCIVVDKTGKLKTLPQRCYTYFQRFEPIATAGYSIYIYHITEEEAAARKSGD